MSKRCLVVIMCLALLFSSSGFFIIPKVKADMEAIIESGSTTLPASVEETTNPGEQVKTATDTNTESGTGTSPGSATEATDQSGLEKPVDISNEPEKPVDAPIPAPLIVVAETSSNVSVITLSFDRVMKDPAGNESNFSVMVDGISDQVALASLNADSTKIDLNLQVPIASGQMVLLSYTAGSLASVEGGLLASFSEVKVVVPQEVKELAGKDGDSLVDSIPPVEPATVPENKVLLAPPLLGPLSNVHALSTWGDPMLGSGMPGVNSGDTIVLPGDTPANTTLTIPAGITSLTIQGSSTYTGLNIELAPGHPGLVLTIQDLNLTAADNKSGINFGNATGTNSLIILGSNNIHGGAGCAGVQVPEGCSLTIDGSGSLTATGDGGAGIGGAEGYNGGTITILGGTIIAKGGRGGAGIGGGYGPYRGADVVIWDGNITATGGDDGSGDHGGAGIGSGASTGNPGTVTIHGGTIVATGGACGAGIGSGRGNGVGGVVTINGGDITATGSDNGSNDDGGAGIGNAAGCGKSSVAIHGGTIRAYGGANAAGIGSGNGSGGVDIAITDATVIAVGGSGIGEQDGEPLASGGAGIGGAASSGNIGCSISNSTVTAQGGGGSAGIGSGFLSGGMPLTVSNSTITATGGENGAGIGSGFYGGGVDLTISSGKIIATGGANAQDIGASLFSPNGHLHGAPGSLTINGWAIIIADDTIDSSGINGPYTFRLFTGSGDPAGVQAVTVAAGDGSFGFTEDTDASGILDGIYLAADTDVFISVAGYYVKTAADPHFMPSLEHNSGAAEVYERGFVYSTSPNPAIGGVGVTKVTVRGATGIYTVEAFELAPATAYHVRAYAVTGGGTVYGEDRAFTPNDPDAPVYFNCSVTDSTISASGATLYADAWSQDGSTLTERGFVYGTAPNPTTTTGTLVPVSISVISLYSAELTGLSAGTTYFVRAYAVGSTGTHYSGERFFTTDAASAPGPGDPIAVVTRGVLNSTPSYTALSGNVIVGDSASAELDIYLSETSENTVPVVTTDPVESAGINQHSAVVSGSVTADGGSAVTEQGFVYDTANNPTTANYKVQAGSGTGDFSVTLTGLTAGTSYYVRAYAVNTKGTAYGDDVSFTTLAAGGGAAAPTVATGSVTNIITSGATVAGNVTSDGGSAVSERGGVYSTSADPTIDNGTKVAANAAGTGEFSVNLPGLLPGTTYHVRAFATNNIGTSYGIDKSFITVASSGGGGGGGGGSASNSTESINTPKPEQVQNPLEPEVKSPVAEPSDLAGHWAHDCIIALIANGIIKGYPDSTIRPEQEITRAEAASLLVQSLGLQDYQLQNPQSSYSDQLPAWAERAILICTEKGLMKGYPDGSFKPDQHITRAEMCAALIQAYPQVMEPGFTLAFIDRDTIPEWARAFIELAAANKLVGGYPDGTFQPDAFIKRAEVFTIICNLKGYHRQHSL